MGRKKLGNRVVLKHEVKTRVSSETFDKLSRLIGDHPTRKMSSLVRDILENRKVKVFTYDRSFDVVMEELSLLRSEIRAIGVNINQITRWFNTYDDRRTKEFYAKIAFNHYVSLNRQIDRVLDIITNLSKKWLTS